MTDCDKPYVGIRNDCRDGMGVIIVSLVVVDEAAWRDNMDISNQDVSEHVITIILKY